MYNIFNDFSSPLYAVMSDIKYLRGLGFIISRTNSIMLTRLRTAVKKLNDGVRV